MGVEGNLKCERYGMATNRTCDAAATRHATRSVWPGLQVDGTLRVLLQGGQQQQQQQQQTAAESGLTIREVVDASPTMMTSGVSAASPLHVQAAPVNVRLFRFFISLSLSLSLSHTHTHNKQAARSKKIVHPPVHS